MIEGWTVTFDAKSKGCWVPEFMGLRVCMINGEGMVSDEMIRSYVTPDLVQKISGYRFDCPDYHPWLRVVSIVNAGVVLQVSTSTSPIV